MKKFNLPALALLMSLNFIALTAPAQNVSVGAWNIQWLGSAGQRPGAAKNIEQRPADLAFYIRESRVDVLSMEEISDTDGQAATRTNRILDRTFRLLNRTNGNRWKYVLFSKKQSNASTQLVGLAWNEKVVRPVGDPFRIPMDVPAGDASWDRWATGMKFTTIANNRTDFVVVPLHMKSNVGGASVTLPQREREAQFLIDALESVRNNFSDQDIVLIGDTNILRRTEPAVSVYTNAGFADLNDLDRATDIRGAPFDRAFVFRSQPEFASSQESVFVPPGIARNDFFVRFSDHYMVRFLIRVMADDD